MKKKLETIPVSISGDHCDYWRIRLNNYWVELIVIGTGFNTVSTLKHPNDWILRVREPEQYFSQWIGQLFIDKNKHVRRLSNGEYQTQFSCHQVENIKTIFKQDISMFSLRDDSVYHKLTPEQVELLMAFIDEIMVKKEIGEPIQISFNLKMLIAYLQHDEKILNQFDVLSIDKQEEVFKQAIEELEIYRANKNNTVLH